MTAENDQMAAQQPAGIERPYYVGRNPRNSIHSRSDAILRLSRDFLIDRSNPLVGVAFGFSIFSVSFLGLGRTRPERSIASVAANRWNQIIVAEYFRPMQS